MLNRFQTKEKTYELAFYAKPPETLKVADKPPLLGGKIQEVPRDEFCRAQGFRYTAGIEIESGLRDRLWHADPHAKSVDINIEYITTHPRTDLVLAPMGEGTGMGVFLAPDAAPIPANRAIMIYEGVLDGYERGNCEGSDYLLGFSYEVKPNILYDHFKQQGYAMHAAKVGGIARFVQGGMGDYELSEATGLSSEDKRHIPTANLVQVINVHGGCPTGFLVTTREILPGEPLMFCYGKEYWAQRPKKIFDSKGAIIGEILNNKITIRDLDYLRTLPIAKRLTPEDIAILGTGYPVEPFNFATKFLHNLQYCTRIYANRYKTNELLFLFLNTLCQAANKTSGDEAYLAVKTLLADKASYQSFLLEIQPLKKEIIDHVKEYNAFKTMQNNATAATKVKNS
jgi:hypothetical protein